MIISLDARAATLQPPLPCGLIHCVLGNLVQNAIKHSPPQSNVLMSFDYGCPSSDSDSKMLCLSVKDHGEGIAPEDQPYIFEKFAQGREKRRGNRTDTGLGLTFCKLATEAHGGKIHLESAVGVGSTFTLALPLK